MSTEDRDDLVQRCLHTAKKSEEQYTFLKEEDVKIKFPYLKLPRGTVAVSVKNAGHINPRILVKAQQLIARNHGCNILDDIVDSIENKTFSSVIVRTGSGKTIDAKKVLLATGAFTECRNLLPEGVRPDMTSTTETCLFVS